VPSPDGRLGNNGGEGAVTRWITQLDDFEVIAERARVTSAIAALTDRYRQLNQEMTRRETPQWMMK
jgi:hypothetical protein